MKKCISYLRIGEWMNSKVTMMLGILSFFCLRNHTAAGRTAREFIAFLLFVSMFLSVSYVANDYSDLEADKKAGKIKVIAGMKRRTVWLSLIAMVLLGTVPALLVVKRKGLYLAVTAIVYLLGIGYSVPGIRFKERGGWGLLECSFAQRCMPLTILPVLEDISGSNLVFWWEWFLLSFLDGLRYILIHQIIDSENDRKSGIHTFVTDHVYRFRQVIQMSCMLEIALCAGILLPMWKEYPVLVTAAVIIEAVFEYAIWKVLNVYAGKDWMVSFDAVPLEGFLNFIVPVLFALILAERSVLGLILVTFYLAVGWKAIKIKLGIAMLYFKSVF